MLLFILRSVLKVIKMRFSMTSTPNLTQNEFQLNWRYGADSIIFFAPFIYFFYEFIALYRHFLMASNVLFFLYLKNLCSSIDLTSVLSLNLQLAVAMSGSIHLFQSVQKSYKTLGIYPCQTNKTVAFNSRNLFVLFCLAQASVLLGGFCLFEAKTMQEFGSSFFMFLTQFYMIFSFSALICRKENIYICI